MRLSILEKLSRFLNRPIAGAWLGLAMSGWLAAVPAQAQVFVPHPDLTPFQLVARDNHCLSIEVIGQHHLPLLEECNGQDNGQKFYLLQDRADIGIDPAHPGATSVIARIVMAGPFDDVAQARGRYMLLGNGANGIEVAEFQNDPVGRNNQYRWGIQRSPHQVADQFTVIANEDEPFFIAGERSVYYGVPGRMIERRGVQGFNQPQGLPCSNAYFGDPAPGVRKACYLANSPEPGTRFDVKLKNIAAALAGLPHTCLAESFLLATEAVLSSCADGSLDNPLSTFTLRPTSYPS